MYVLGAPAPSRLNVGLGEADIALSPSGERIVKLAPSGASDAWRGEIPLSTPANQQAGKPPYLSPEGERATSHNVRFRPLPERRLVEGAQFPAVELGALVAHRFACADADLEVRGDRFLVETVRLPGQLEFAVEWLVADAEQGAIGDAETIALRGDRRRLHVDADRARLQIGRAP